MKLCVNCKYYTRVPELPILEGIKYGQCLRFKRHDPVSGMVTTNMAIHNRENVEICGQDAKHFEEITKTNAGAYMKTCLKCKYYLTDKDNIGRCTRFGTVDLVTNELMHCEPAIFMREGPDLCGPSGRYYTEN